MVTNERAGFTEVFAEGIRQTWTGRDGQPLRGWRVLWPWTPREVGWDGALAAGAVVAMVAVWVVAGILAH